jgi:hypothetical protein
MDLVNGQSVSRVPAGPSLNAAELITFWVGPAFCLHYITCEEVQHESLVNKESNQQTNIMVAELKDPSSWT